uniref:AlNc14C193G8515 protein n=1 Tax=Albugo laibachii Nc14 TaxID=890382 RepID=F0WQ35_9STRA|nr:AlNc14C193G8515 [Albugo laibachii Nc14]|eukprot:CCA23440.1 AlNc14C193G8515 [Albugo laibachii Nc14]
MSSSIDWELESGRWRLADDFCFLVVIIYLLLDRDTQIVHPIGNAESVICILYSHFHALLWLHLIKRTKYRCFTSVFSQGEHAFGKVRFILLHLKEQIAPVKQIKSHYCTLDVACLIVCCTRPRTKIIVALEPSSINSVVKLEQHALEGVVT